VESSVSTSDALVRPWRTATIVASSVAAVELVVLLAVAVALLGKPVLDWAQGSTERHATAAVKKTREPAIAHRQAPRPAPLGTPKLARTETSVLVLNGNGIAGAAAAEAELVRHKGYVLADVGNAPRSDYGRSVVMYRPGYEPEAARLARDTRVKIVSPLDGLRLKDLMGAHAAIVIGSR
jgi:LytR cell envelope-related transcriptional attenuator